MKRKLLAVLLSVVMMLSLVSCGRDKPDTPPDDGPAKDTVTIAWKLEPSNLDPTGNNDIACIHTSMMIFSGLFKRVPTGVEKDLCTEYYTEKDANGEETIWVFKLRDGVKFHDGSALTADDVVASLTHAQQQSAVAAATAFYEKVEKVNDLTVKLYTKGVYATTVKALADKACSILPSELIESGHDFANNPIGCGPYKFVKWNKGDNILLTANEDYYDGVASIKNVNWRIIAEGTSRTVGLESGELDLIMEVATVDVPRLEDDDRFTVTVSDGSTFRYFCMNTTKAPFNDINFRKFLAAAINREAALDVATEGFGTPLLGSININVPGYSDKGAQGYDPEAAKQYLAAWGGDPTQVKFKMFGTSDEVRRFSEVIQSALLEYGIQAEIEMTESSNCSSIVKTGEYDAFVWGCTTDDFTTYVNNIYYVDDNVHLGNKFRMNYDDSLNYMVDEINATIDEDARKAMITEYSEALNAKQYTVPLYCNQVVTAFDKNLKGVALDCQGYLRVEDLSW